MGVEGWGHFLREDGLGGKEEAREEEGEEEEGEEMMRMMNARCDGGGGASDTSVCDGRGGRMSGRDCNTKG